MEFVHPLYFYDKLGKFIVSGDLSREDIEPGKIKLPNGYKLKTGEVVIAVTEGSRLMGDEIVRDFQKRVEYFFQNARLVLMPEKIAWVSNHRGKTPYLGVNLDVMAPQDLVAMIKT